MSNVRSFTRSFSGGVVTPEFWAQIGDSKFQTGLAKCRNFITLPHGPAANRPGTQFVTSQGQAGRHRRRCAADPLRYSTTQTLALEFGAGYIRFHTMEATVLAGSPAAYNARPRTQLANWCPPVRSITTASPDHRQRPPNATYWWVSPAERCL